MNDLIGKIRVDSNYTRSINIERDSEQVASFRPYVITTRAAQTLERMATALESSGSPKAWALVGPYGAGKSAFGLYLSNLLGSQEGVVGKSAAKTLKLADAKLNARLQKCRGKGRGFCTIALTGSPEPLAQRLVAAMLPAAEAFFEGRPGRAPAILSEIRLANVANGILVSDLIALMLKLQSSVARAGGAGVLLVIDELGKFLEYEARHRGATDIFLLQALAEHTLRAEEAPLMLVVLLHQSIELYAQSLGEQLKNEWKKVHGRFESVPFLETTEQMLRVMQSAISSDLPKSMRLAVERESVRIAQELGVLGALPPGMKVNDAKELFAKCYPLHPISQLILPALCQRIAQNERTLFSYLGSREPNGFLESISRLTPGPDGTVEWIRPSEIYEYFILNQPGVISDQATHRRWAEVVTALDRLGNDGEVETALLKTIGLLNIVGAQGGMKASEGILKLCVKAPGGKGKGLKNATQNLVDRSIISYRKFNHEYRVWQGSDFDLAGAVKDQLGQIGKVDPAEILNETSPLSALVARRHAIESGTLRYFEPLFVTRTGFDRIQRTDKPSIFVCLAGSTQEAEAFKARAREIGVWHTAVVVCGTGSAIADAVVDVLALRRVQRQSSELANDPVGQRELSDRLATAISTERDLVGSIFEEPERFEWVIGEYNGTVQNKRDLQIRLSSLLDAVYCKAPAIQNELIHRDRPSATAVAGRKKLLMAMLDRSSEEDLGIEKFPAEKAMYRAILRASGLHSRQIDGTWKFQAPGTDASDVLRLAPMWAALTDLLQAEKGKPLAVTAIYEMLASPPFGVKAGSLPILLFAYFQAMKLELAITENGQFVPFITREVLEGLLSNPRIYALQHFYVGAGSNLLFECYAEAITGEKPKEANLISVLQPLSKLMVGFPDYTKQTRRVSPEAQQIRNLFFASKDPVQLLFSDLPAALGFDFQSSQNTDQVAAFGNKLKSAIGELKGAYHALLRGIESMLSKAFVLEKKMGLEDVRARLRGRCEGLNVYTIDPQCTAFIGRLTESFGDETQWLISLASFLARKPPEKWIDANIEGVSYKLTELVARVRDLQKLQLHYEAVRATKHGDLEVSLIRIVSTKGGERQAFVTLDEQGRLAVRSRVEEVLKMLESLPNDELKMATLSQVAAQLIPELEGKSELEEFDAKEAFKKGAV
jgi:hypothetical protein